MRTKIDAGAATYLPLCPCGWRGDPYPTRLAALAAASRHEQRAHPGGDRHARKALDSYLRRAATKVPS